MDTLKQFLVREGEERYVASAAYQANLSKVRTELERLQELLVAHKADYDTTDQNDWGYSGDIAHVAEKLKEINDFLDKDVSQ